MKIAGVDEIATSIAGPDSVQAADVWRGEWIALEREAEPENGEILADVSWIWVPASRRSPHEKMSPLSQAFFRRTFDLGELAGIDSALVYVTADDDFTLYVNGARAASDDRWRRVSSVDIRGHLRAGTNVLAVEVNNRLDQHENLRGGVGNPAGLAAKVIITRSATPLFACTTDEAWMTISKEQPGWTGVIHETGDWKPAATSTIRGLAKWRASDEYSNRWYCYRKEFHLAQPVSRAVARMAVDSKYWLWINGAMVVFEGGAKRGPDPENTYFDTVDLSPHLRPGRNTIAVLAWYWGRDGLARVTGHDEDGAFYEGRMQSIRGNFDRVFWTGSEYRSPGYEGLTDDRGHGLAVVAGIADPRDYPAIVRFLEGNYQASPYVEKYILEALFIMGRDRQALTRMLDRYRTHLAEDLTTLFEGWGIGSEGFGGGTINHSWSGGPLTLLSQYVAGVAPLEVAYARFQIRPNPGGLNHAQASVPSIKGAIDAEFSINGRTITQRVVGPGRKSASPWRRDRISHRL